MREKLMQWLSDLTPAAETAPEEKDFGMDMAPPPETLARAPRREPEAAAPPLADDSMDALRRRADRP